MSVVAGVGLNSGIDYNQLIASLMEVERQPLYRLQSKQSGYNKQVSVYGEISTRMSALKTAMDNLRTTSNFYAKTISVSDTTVLDATVSNSAAAGNYTVGLHSVAGKIQLAAPEKELHTGVAASTTVVNNSGADKVFQYTYAGTQRSITVANGTTLEGLRDAINSDASNPGVTATILNDGTNYRLVLTGKDTGSAKTITIDAGTTLDGTGSTVDFRAATFTESQAAQDAKFRVDGVDITRSSNSITDVITGVTFTLKKEISSGSVTLSVTNDTNTIKERIDSFVSAYNNLVSYVSSQSTYNTTTHTGGPLFGDSTSRNAINRLRSIVTTRVDGLPEDMRVLAQIGISTNKDGTLSVNTTTLTDKLSTSLDKVANLFTTATSGAANQLYDYIDDVTDFVDGAVTVRTKGLNSSTKEISDKITALQDKLVVTERNLSARFANLEALLGGLTSQGAFLTKQFG
ncbi:MAG: flagellar hook-associated protein 2 [bacterium]|nr:MAG: flagellar hook-associated protein 2 [bacterium]